MIKQAKFLKEIRRALNPITESDIVKLRGYGDNMKIYFTQIYIQIGVSFPFEYTFQSFLGTKITDLVKPSLKFTELHGDDYSLGFYISAKKELEINEIVGPSIYKKDKDIEYSIFLPYTQIMKQSEPNRSALENLFGGIYYVLGEYEVDITKLKNEEKKIIDKIMSSPEMFRKEDE